MTERNYILRADGEWVRDALGRPISFTYKGAHRWINRHRPQSTSVCFLNRPGRKPESTDL